jgi:hypothetical protein
VTTVTKRPKPQHLDQDDGNTNNNDNSVTGTAMGQEQHMKNWCRRQRWWCTMKKTGKTAQEMLMMPLGP